MGQCIRGKMVEVGLFPPAPATAEADATEPAQIADLAPSEEAVPDEPALDVTPPANNAEGVDAEAADNMIAATFGLLRAEPDGSVVIAGNGTPGSQVEIFANDASIGSTDVESSGDWAFVPDVPLPPGNLEITLGEVGKPGRAPQSFVVVINEDKKTQPLVVASVPGQASEVLQGLTPQVVASVPVEAEQPSVQTAVADTVAEPAEVGLAETEDPSVAELPAEEAPLTAATDVAESPSGADPEPAADIASTGQAEPASDVVIAAADEGNVVETAPSQEVADTREAGPAEVAAAPEVAEPVEVAAVPETPEIPAEPAISGDVATDVVAAADEPETDIAAVELVDPVEGEVADQAAIPVAAPTIDAIEIDGDRTFFAGAGPNGAIVRLYVDDAHIDDATVADGRWLVEAGPVLNKPNQRVRADLLAAGSSTVVARSEVDFIVDLPGTEEAIEVAESVAPVEPGEVSAAGAASTEVAEAVQPADVTPAGQPSATNAESPVVQQADAPVAQPETLVAEPQTQDASPSVQVSSETSEPSETVAASETVEPVEVAPSATATEPTANDVAEVAEPAPSQVAEPSAPAETAPTEPAEPPVPTMVAVSLGDPDAQRFASGKAIIRRGDNLWTIARRVYGEGLKFTTIYEANTGQIRNPNRIYPGQVFDLPSAATQ
ncbi:MAG: LysM peptidoglycan-binding domain-containing protein [Phyllobacteriaceae bacterium]|nr:LysM peptidoglycan-binding domain-containing protein [Phyllobacteriaceae bacterium]